MECRIRQIPLLRESHPVKVGLRPASNRVIGCGVQFSENHIQLK